MKRAALHIVLLLTMLVVIGARFYAPQITAPVVGTWQIKTSMPEARSGATAVVLGEFVYVMGGVDASGSAVNRVDRYNPVSNTWDTVASLIDARFNTASVVWNNTILVIGGSGGDNTTLSSVEQYNPETNTWRALPALLEAREGHSATVLEGKIYAVGGSDAQGRIYDSVEVYNAEQSSWSISDQWELDLPRASFGLVAVNDSAYAIGGFNTFGPIGFVQRFHPNEGSATREAILPARGGLAAAFKGDRVFVMGGVTASLQAVSTTNVYFPAEDRWTTEAPMNIPRAQFPAAVFGNELYVFGGEDAGGVITASVEVFTTGIAPIAENDVVVTNEDEPVTFNVLSNDEDQPGLGISVASFSQPLGGSVAQVANDGTLTYTPDANFNGTDRFTYTIVNGEGSVATAEVTITIIPINDRPVFLSSPEITGVTGITYEYNIEVMDVDGPQLSVTADILPGWLVLTDSGNGIAQVTGVPAIEDVGDHLVTLRGSDGMAEQVQSFVVTVFEGVPPAPVLVSPENNADSVRTPIVFSWMDLGASSWDLQIATNDQFTNIVINVPNLTEPMYEVAQLDPEFAYFWRVRASNNAGISAWSAPFAFTLVSTVGTENEEDLPLQPLILHAPYPNPTQGAVWIEFEGDYNGNERLTLTIYDLKGRQVISLYDAFPALGRNRLKWDGMNEWNQPVASGTYYVRMTQGSHQQVQSLVLMR